MCSLVGLEDDFGNVGILLVGVPCIVVGRTFLVSVELCGAVCKLDSVLAQRLRVSSFNHSWVVGNISAKSASKSRWSLVANASVAERTDKFNFYGFNIFARLFNSADNVSCNLSDAVCAGGVRARRTNHSRTNKVENTHRLYVALDVAFEVVAYRVNFFLRKQRTYFDGYFVININFLVRLLNLPQFHVVAVEFVAFDGFEYVGNKCIVRNIYAFQQQSCFFLCLVNLATEIDILCNFVVLVDEYFPEILGIWNVEFVAARAELKVFVERSKYKIVFLARENPVHQHIVLCAGYNFQNFVFQALKVEVVENELLDVAFLLEYLCVVVWVDYLVKVHFVFCEIFLVHYLEVNFGHKFL